MMLLILSALLIILLLINIDRYDSIINPLTAFIAWEFLLFTVLPILFAGYFIESSLGLSKFKTLQYLYIFGGVLGFFIFSRSFYFKLFLLGPNFFLLSKRRPSVGLLLIVFVLITLILFLALATIGGGGLSWITDTRTAYINNRSGAGIFWVLIQWVSLFMLSFFLLKLKPKKVISILLYALPFIVIGYFTGSKSNILSILIIVFVYYNFYCYRVNSLQLLLGVVSLIILFTFLVFFQSSNSTLTGFEALVYFSEYTSVSSMYLSDEFLEIGYGKYSLSSLWYYVPRGIYPEKPFEYGVLNIHKVLFPGAAAIGNTPGISPWMLTYIDFGHIGVLLHGMIITSFSRFIYLYYVHNKKNYVLFLIMIHVCLYNVLALFSTFMVIILIITLFHFRLVRRRL